MDDENTTIWCGMNNPLEREVLTENLSLVHGVTEILVNFRRNKSFFHKIEVSFRRSVVTGLCVPVGRTTLTALGYVSKDSRTRKPGNRSKRGRKLFSIRVTHEGYTVPDTFSGHRYWRKVRMEDLLPQL